MCSHAERGNKIINAERPSSVFPRGAWEQDYMDAERLPSVFPRGAWEQD